VNVVDFFGDDRINYDGKQEQVYKQIDFLLCESCFWCATCIDSQQKHMTRCPSCKDFRLKYLIINDNEIYNLDMRRISLE
jgi:Zn finger protein HypA/HybF involved in hydrogenase expression